MLFVYIPTIILKYDYFWVCGCEKHIVVTICYILYSYIIRTDEPVLEKYNRNYLRRKQYIIIIKIYFFGFLISMRWAEKMYIGKL